MPEFGRHKSRDMQKYSKNEFGNSKFQKKTSLETLFCAKIFAYIIKKEYLCSDF